MGIDNMRIFITLLLGPILLSIWPASSESATLPTLPLAFINTAFSQPSGQTINVNAGGDFQAALDKAVPGDTIVLQAGATFTGPFRLPNKAGSGWIYIQSSALGSLPAAGMRVTPANAANMPKIVVGANVGGAIQTDARAHHFRFVGIEFRPVANNFVFSLIQIGNNESQLADLPNNITFDRCYIHGDPTVGGRRGIAANGNSIAVVDSYISDFKEKGADSQALMGWSGAGPFKIVNNFLEAAGENVMFGGAEPSVSNLVPSDIEIRRNHFFKPLAWIGSGFQVKNLLEFKNAQRVLVEGNILENNWVAAQNGFSLLITPRNENGGAPWSVTQDIWIRLNRLVNVSQGLNLSGRDTNFTSQVTRRVLFENNILEVTGLEGSSGRIFQVTNGPIDVTIRHNTGLILFSGGSTAFTESNPKADQFDFRDNIVSNGSFGFSGTGTGAGNSTLTTYYTNYTFIRNAIISGGPTGSYPQDNFFPSNNADVSFVNFSGGNYRLSASSSFKAGAANQASDGKDLGADIDAVEAAIGGSGSAKVLPPQKLRVTN